VTGSQIVGKAGKIERECENKMHRIWRLDKRGCCLSPALTHFLHSFSQFMLSPLSWSPEQAKEVLNCGSKFSQLQTVYYRYLVFDNQSNGGRETATYKKNSIPLFYDQ